MTTWRAPRRPRPLIHIHVFIIQAAPRGKIDADRRGGAAGSTAPAGYLSSTRWQHYSEYTELSIWPRCHGNADTPAGCCMGAGSGTVSRLLAEHCHGALALAVTYRAQWLLQALFSGQVAKKLWTLPAKQSCGGSYTG